MDVFYFGWGVVCNGKVVLGDWNMCVFCVLLNYCEMMVILLVIILFWVILKNKSV